MGGSRSRGSTWNEGKTMLASRVRPNTGVRSGYSVIVRDSAPLRSTRRPRGARSIGERWILSKSIRVVFSLAETRNHRVRLIAESSAIGSPPGARTVSLPGLPGSPDRLILRTLEDPSRVAHRPAAQLKTRAITPRLAVASSGCCFERARRLTARADIGWIHSERRRR